MQRDDKKISAERQQAAHAWALEILDAVIPSLVAQKRIGPDHLQKLEEFRAIQGTFAFITRPDVEIRRKVT